MGQAAERGLYMIEIIREESFDSEQEKRELPKNIRQIGSPDIGDRIYIENKVHEYMHPYDALQEKTVYVLLGRFENMIGRQCVFVEAAICLEEIAFEGECPVWCKETLRMSKKEKSEKNRKKLRNPENMGFSTFLFLKIDILGVAKK